MKAAQRREEILSLIGNSRNPVSANFLSERYSVSRQVIVQDIAILRANGSDITSTNRGYLLNSGIGASRVFKCRHSFEEIADEGNTVINLGGKIEDVFVNHRVYGRISARLDLNSRIHVEELYRSLVSGASKPLMSVTDGYHYHTVRAESEEILNQIEKALIRKLYIVPEK